MEAWSTFNACLAKLNGTLKATEALIGQKKLKRAPDLYRLASDLKAYIASRAAAVDVPLLLASVRSGAVDASLLQRSTASLMEDLRAADAKLQKLSKTSKIFKGDEYFFNAISLVLKNLQNTFKVALSDFTPPTPPPRPPPYIPPPQPQQPGPAPAPAPAALPAPPAPLEEAPPAPPVVLEASAVEEEDLLVDEPSEADSWELLLEEAEGGGVDEAWLAAIGYLQGEGLPVTERPDRERGLRYLRICAEAGNPSAQHMLGRLYEAGDPLLSPEGRPDLVRARELYAKAASSELLAALEDQAYFLEHGLGGPQDEPEAAQLYTKASMLGSILSPCNLGVMYMYGRGVEKSATRAVDLFRLAAHQRCAEALNNLGLCYEEGVGVRFSLAVAESCYLAAADLGSPPGMANLGRLMMLTGRPEAALEWLRRSFLASGDPTTCFMLGNCLEHIGYGAEIEDPIATLVVARALEGSRRDAAVSPLVDWGEIGRPPHPPSLDSVPDLYRYAADRSQPSALNKMAQRLWDQGREAESLVKFKAAARKGHKGAMESLAIVLESGLAAVARDAEAARDLYACGAALGSERAKESLEKMLVAGVRPY